MEPVNNDSEEIDIEDIQEKTYNILVLGPKSSGKSTLINTFCNAQDHFEKCTNLRIKKILSGDVKLILKIWKLDIGDLCENTVILSSYFRDADSVIIVMDVKELLDENDNITIQSDNAFRQKCEYYIQKTTELYDNYNKKNMIYSIACNMKDSTAPVFKDYLNELRYTKLSCKNKKSVNRLIANLTNEIDAYRASLKYNLIDEDEQSDSDMPY